MGAITELVPAGELVRRFGAAAEPTPAGEPFPTGHTAPPAHPGCRCLAVAADLLPAR